MKTGRIEEDFIGKMEIPIDALYGIYTARTVRNLSFSEKKLFQYPRYIHALAYVKKAAALANFEAGLLPIQIKEAIVWACDEILDNRYHESFVIDVLHGGGGIGTNMNINEVIANLANEKLGGERGTYHPVHQNEHVNLSQSTSDVCHTANRIAVILSFQSLRLQLEMCIQVMNELSEKFDHVETMSRTCLQDAMKVRIGESFRSYAAMLERRLHLLSVSVDYLHQINLGGTVIGSGVGAPQHYREVVVQKLCEVSNLPLRHRENLFDAAQHIDDLAAVSKELHLLASCLIKLAKDLRLRSSGPEGGFGEIVLPAVQAGSSFFPGKINPIVPETLIQCCFQVLGCDRVVQATLEHGELDLNVFEGIACINILDAMKMLERALASFIENCLLGIEVNEQRCKQLANSLIPAIVELKEKFGYSTVSRWLKEKSREELIKLLQCGGNDDDKNI
ncbi:MAG: aspartate ammonia-lyase [Bacillaceae bacterium]|uniref:Aspartate ammonia-lyase n=1 Tax=Aeribacillus pallidus TaxID=33936 RepID=A0A165Z765_9BACI|nr:MULTISPECIES: lyase family protein [Aeribacillus]KZN97922.1 aspartate ammonia-lyase [Aeribacillus pallidus]REJ20998.1 MAG: aspartate ammonia-lyase [Bacillaceae bacterium]TVZ84311.1 aspartate ammonia-lyase [Aeribacillus composti]